MSDDNWVHRARNMRCRTCMYYAPKMGLPGGPDSDVNVLKEAIVGRCRRHAPTMNGWPVMFPDDWCGDHKLDENKA